MPGYGEPGEKEELKNTKMSYIVKLFLSFIHHL